jgi:hypothetical protein
VGLASIAYTEIIRAKQGKLPMRYVGQGPFYRWSLKVAAATLVILAFGAQARAPGPSATDSQPRISEQDADTAIARLKDLADGAEQWIRAFPSSHLQMEPVLEQCDYDREKIFEWVRSETRWVPYQGALRGAWGVLMDRRGNSLDRSLLLSNLLLAAGYETRLARAQLSPAAARALLEAHSGATGKSSNAASAAQANEKARRQQQEVAAQASDLAALAGLTGNAGSGQQTEAFLSDLSDHWWVQVKEGNTWQDLDPMAPDGEPIAGGGQPSIVSLDKLPDDIHHRLEIKLVIERWEAGKLVEEVPLRHEFAVDEIPTPAYFQAGFAPFSEEWASRDDADDGLSPVEIADSAGFWRPYLKLNGKLVPGEWFDDSGRLKAPMKLASAKKLSTANIALSTLGSQPAAEAPPTFLTAAWFEFVTTDPGKRGERERREIFDLLGQYRTSAGIPGQLALSLPEVRDRGLALLGQSSGLVLNSTPHPEAVDQFAFDVFVRNKNVFIALVYLAAGREDKRVPIAMGRADFRPIDLITMAALRDLWSRHVDYVYIDRINLISSHLVRPIEGDGEATKFASDIVINRIGVTPGAPLDNRLVRLEQGVLDTLVETRFSGEEESINTFRHFQSRAKDASDWITIKGDAVATNLPNGFTAGEIGRLEASARNGHVLVVSPKAFEMGGRQYASWWQIDPADGTTLGRGYRGWGTEMTETLETETVATRETAPVAQQAGKNNACKMLDAAVGVTVDLAAEWAAAEANARAAGRGALIDKIKAADPGIYDDLPPWCR